MKDRSGFGVQSTEDRRQKTEDRRQKTEDRRQKTEDRRQKTEDRRQKTEDRRQKPFMDEIRQEFLDIVTRVKAHLEYQKALGVRHIETVLAAAVRTPLQQAAGRAPADADERTSVTPESPADGLAAVRGELGDCTRCKLHKGR